MAAVVFSLAGVACGNKMSPVFIVRHCSYRRLVYLHARIEHAYRRQNSVT